MLAPGTWDAFAWEKKKIPRNKINTHLKVVVLLMVLVYPLNIW
jgi:hypothetical protein